MLPPASRFNCMYWPASGSASPSCRVALLLGVNSRRPHRGSCCGAAMAQRKGELLKLETLERIASLLTELQGDAAMAEACDEAGDGCPLR